MTTTKKTKSEKKTEYKFDLFKYLPEFEKGNLDIWDNLSDDERKGFSPLIVMQWLSATSDSIRLQKLTKIVNNVVFNPTISKHKQLLAMLLAITSKGRSAKRKFISMPKSKGRNKSIDVLTQYFGYSTREASMYLDKANIEWLVELAEDLGWEKDDINLLEKEWKTK